MTNYDPKIIENTNKARIENEEFFKFTPNSKLKYYALDMFPYPSGAGLHVGHARIYTCSDIFTRYKRVKGYNVLHPTGWDAFGLPAEQYAIKTKTHPEITTKINIDNFRAQMKSLGISYDYSREVATTDPDFYKWTQWIFIQLYKKGLAFVSHEPVNWCPSCKTGLANEDLEGNVCERCKTVVEKKPLKQWVLDIKKYADRMLDDLDTLNEWPLSLKDAQRNWIGRSEGAQITFSLSDNLGSFDIFTTRADTLAGCTYTVLSPEHSLVSKLISSGAIKNIRNVESYIKTVSQKSDIERTALGKEKTGVKLEGVNAINPITKEEVPIYIADYVLNGYGTGAIMAVPAHDERDFEFAKKFNISVKKVIVDESGKDSEDFFVNIGVLVNSGEFDGLNSEEAKKKIVEKVGGKFVTSFKLQDWVFSRQRYWGEPIPMVHDENGKYYPVRVEDLPVKLPQVESYEPTGTGEGPLALIKSWVEVNGYINEIGDFVQSDTGENVKTFYRETNTMPQWAGSSWYYARFIDPHNQHQLVDSSLADTVLPVDCYVGGAEHSTRHLIYARFWHKFLFDIGVFKHPEPFKRVELVGLVSGPDGRKMSKSLGNVIDPSEVINQWGADTTRLYIAFMGDFYETTSWKPEAIVGPRRFIEKIYSFKDKVNETAVYDKALLEQTVKKVEESIEEFRFNTAVSSLMIFANNCLTKDGVHIDAYKKLIIMLAPFIPFVADEISREVFGKSVYELDFPVYNKENDVVSDVTIAVSINGKLRGTIVAGYDESDDKVLEIVKSTAFYTRYVEGVEPKKVIIVKNKIVNIVI